MMLFSSKVFRILSHFTFSSMLLFFTWFTLSTTMALNCPVWGRAIPIYNQAHSCHTSRCLETASIARKPMPICQDQESFAMHMCLRTYTHFDIAQHSQELAQASMAFCLETRSSRCQAHRVQILGQAWRLAQAQWHHKRPSTNRTLSKQHAALLRINTSKPSPGGSCKHTAQSQAQSSDGLTLLKKLAIETYFT